MPSRLETVINKKSEYTVHHFDSVVDRTGTGNLKTVYAGWQPGMISLAGAEFDFKTAPSLIRAVQECAANGLFGFTLRDDRYVNAVRWWLGAVRQWDVAADWIVPTHGTIFSLATLIRLVTQEGDGIIIQPPVYGRYEQAARRLNRRIVTNPLHLKAGRYRMDLAHLERCMADTDNKLFVLCNPNNPTTTVWDRADLEAVAQMAATYNVTVYSDEIFADVTFADRRVVPFGAVGKAAGTRTVVATSLGKAFSLTGVNHANAIIIDSDLRAAFRQQRDADHYGSIDPLTRAAVIGAYSEEGLDWFEAMVAYIAGNIEFLQHHIGTTFRSIVMHPVEGTYVAWLDARPLGLPEPELIRFLNEEAQLCVDPGSDYGIEGTGFIRLNLATPRSQLEGAVNALVRAIQLHFPEHLHEP